MARRRCDDPPQHRTLTTAPELSVVIPTRNRPGAIVETLTALAAQTLADDRFEVIVVDDGSVDDIAAAIEGQSWPFQLRAARQPNAGAGAARNRGASMARSPILLFLDDDIAADPGLLAMHLAAQDGQRTVVIGHMDFDVPEGSGTLVRSLAAWWPQHYRRLSEDGASVSYMAAFSGNLSIPATLFREVGGFATDLPRSDDVELGYRLAEAGARFVYAADARSRQIFDKDGAAILRDAESEGRAAALLLDRHPGMLKELRAGSLGATGPLRRLSVLALARLPRSVAGERLVTGLPRSVRSRAFDVVYDGRYWRGLRSALGTGALWDALVHPPMVLMYHAFAPPGSPASRWIVPADRFERHLDAIVRAGFRVVPLDDVIECMQRGEPMAGRTVVITIDDGYADVLTEAAPRLDARGMPATLFLVTSKMSGTNDWDAGPPLGGRPLLAWSDVGSLGEAGIAVGGHSRTHARLDRLTEEELHSEIDGCVEDLRAHGIAGTLAFAYPYGKESDATRTAVGRSGFDAGLGIEPGRVTASTPLDALPRLEVHGTYGTWRLRIGLLAGTLDGDVRLRRRISSSARNALGRRRRSIRRLVSR